MGGEADVPGVLIPSRLTRCRAWRCHEESLSGWSSPGRGVRARTRRTAWLSAPLPLPAGGVLTCYAAAQRRCWPLAGVLYISTSVAYASTVPGYAGRRPRSRSATAAVIWARSMPRRLTTFPSIRRLICIVSIPSGLSATASCSAFHPS